MSKSLDNDKLTVAKIIVNSEGEATFSLMDAVGKILTEEEQETIADLSADILAIISKAVERVENE